MAILKGFPPSNRISPTIYILPERWNYWLKMYWRKNGKFTCRCGESFVAPLSHSGGCSKCKSKVM